MSDTIPIQDWLQIIDREYLSTFIKDGGASVKFAVTPDPLKSNLDAEVSGYCQRMDYRFVKLDAVTIRVHMPQDIFFGLARQIDWRLLARRMIMKLAARGSYTLEGVDPAACGNIFDAIAKANDLEPDSVLREIRPNIENAILKDTQMARDFRVAMSHLCWLENTHEDGHYQGEPILDWLTGVNTRISNVRSFSIYTPINRATARYFIESALYWVRHAGYPGTVILLDNSRVTVARNPKDGLRFYTRPTAMDHYELLREFIDDLDRLAGMLLVVVTNQDFAEENKPRSYRIYQALRYRIMNDVRDRNRVNPIASLVGLE